MITRTNKDVLYKKILSCLKQDELSISDISTREEINWETTRRNLEILKGLGIIAEKEADGKRIFFIKDPSFIEGNPDTLLGLSLTEEQRETANSLFNKIKRTWYKHSTKPLKKTFLQKIAVKLIKDNDIKNIPYGWYLFGMMSVLQCDPSLEIEVKNDYLKDKYDAQIDKTVIEYQKFDTTKDLLIFQYQAEQNDLYLTRLKLCSDFLSPIAESDLPMIKKRLVDFALCLKKSEDNIKVIELANAFISITIQLINKLNINELEDIRPNIINTFEALWECIATYNLYHSLLENKFYTKEELSKRYQLKIIPHLETCEMYLNLLSEHVPKTTQRTDELSKFKGTLAK